MPWKKHNYQNAKHQKNNWFCVLSERLKQIYFSLSWELQPLLVGKALLKKLIILRVLETYGESDKNTIRLPRQELPRVSIKVLYRGKSR
jgi:hypothetical protein